MDHSRCWEAGECGGVCGKLPFASVFSVKIGSKAISSDIEVLEALKRGGGKV